MRTWIVLRRSREPGSDPTATDVVGRVTAHDELAARFAAHARWVEGTEDRLEIVPLQSAPPPMRRVAHERAHLNLQEEGRQMDAVFADRLVP